jgi:hypothetical protein
MAEGEADAVAIVGGWIGETVRGGVAAIILRMGLVAGIDYERCSGV